MVKLTNILLVFIFFLQIYLILVCGEKNIMPNLTNSQELEPDPLENKYQEPEPLEKKSGARAGAATKLAGSPALV